MAMRYEIEGWFSINNRVVQQLDSARDAIATANSLRESGAKDVRYRTVTTRDVTWETLQRAERKEILNAERMTNLSESYAALQQVPVDRQVNCVHYIGNRVPKFGPGETEVGPLTEWYCDDCGMKL